MISWHGAGSGASNLAPASAAAALSASENPDPSESSSLSLFLPPPPLLVPLLCPLCPLLCLLALGRERAAGGARMLAMAETMAEAPFWMAASFPTTTSEMTF